MLVKLVYVSCNVLFFSLREASGRTGNQTDNLETYEGAGFIFYYLTYKSDDMRLKLNALLWGIYDISFKEWLWIL